MLTRCRIDSSHFRGIFDLHHTFDPTCEFVSLDHFVVYFYKIEGWVVLDGDKVVAAVYFDSYVPHSTILLHCVSDPEYKTRWVTRSLLRNVFSFVYDTLGLPRVSGYCVVGLTDSVGKSLNHLGFSLEGVQRRAAFVNGEHWDIGLYGMLREECRWIK